MPPFKATAREIELAHIDIEAVDLRTAGWTYPMIAAHQGCTERTAKDRVKRALVRWYNHDTEETRLLETERLDRATERLMGIIAKATGVERTYVRHPDTGEIVRTDDGVPREETVFGPDGEPVRYQTSRDDDRAIRAIEKLVQVSARRASLLGLDQPKQVRAEVSVDVEGNVTHEHTVDLTILDAFKEYTEVLGEIVAEERGEYGYTDAETVDAELVDAELVEVDPA